MTPPVRLLLGAVVATVFVASASAQVTRNTAPVPPPAPNPANSADQGNIDLAYGAFQRGHYLTAFNEASKRAQQNDPAAMTLLGEIYAQGLGVGRDDSKAAQWYKMAAAKGDRDALFALAMFNFQGRATTKNLEEAARLLEAAAKLGHAGAAYDLGLLYLQGQQFPQDIKRAGELFALAAEGGNSEAQYALATHVQRRPRRAEGHAQGNAADAAGLGRRQSRRDGRICNRAIQRQKASTRTRRQRLNCS